MGSVVMFGHGGFTPKKEYAPEVLIPPETTLRFFSDAGQVLLLPVIWECGKCHAEHDDLNCPSCGAKYDEGFARTDLRKVAQLDIWGHFAQTDAPLRSRAVTYNFALYPENREETRTLALDLVVNAQWGVDDVITPGLADPPIYLCTGTADTCPTPALLVQDRLSKNPKPDEQRAEPVPDKRWLHNCEGMLCTEQGKDMLWLACTSMMFATPNLPSLVTASEPGPGYGMPEYWVPEDRDLDNIRALNRKNLDAIGGSDSVSIAVGGFIVLIGAGHDAGAAAYLGNWANVEDGVAGLEQGQILVTVDGTLEVQGIHHPDNQQQVSDMLIAMEQSGRGFYFA